MTRTEFLSKLLKYQSLQHASTKKTNSDGTWKNHKYLYIDKNGNYVYEDKNKKDDLKNDDQLKQKLLMKDIVSQENKNIETIKQQSASQLGSAKQGESEGKAQQKYQEEQKLKLQSANQSGRAKESDSQGNDYQRYLDEQKLKKVSANQSGRSQEAKSEGEKQQEYLDKKKAEKAVWAKENPYDAAIEKINQVINKNRWNHNQDEIQKILLEIPDAKNTLNRGMDIIDKMYQKNKDTEWKEYWNAINEQLGDTYDEMNEKIFKNGEGSYYFVSSAISNELDTYLRKIIHQEVKPGDRYGLNNRDQEMKKSQMIFQNLSSEEVNPIVTEKGKELTDKMESLFVIQNDSSFNYETEEEKEEYYKHYENIKRKNATNEINELLKEIRQNEHKDPETGLPLKEYECTIEQDMEIINYPRQLSNYEEVEKYTKNCAMCTVAMALRQKGYDVSAGNTEEADDYYNIHNRFSEFDIFEGAESIEFEPYSSKEKDNFYEYIQTLPVGAYGDLSVAWNGLTTGHSMFFRVEEDGTFQIYDCQTGEKETIKSITDRSHAYQLTRLDNTEVNTWLLRNKNWTKYY